MPKLPGIAFKDLDAGTIFYRTFSEDKKNQRKAIVKLNKEYKSENSFGAASGPRRNVYCFETNAMLRMHPEDRVLKKDIIAKPYKRDQDNRSRLLKVFNKIFEKTEE